MPQTLNITLYEIAQDFKTNMLAVTALIYFWYCYKPTSERGWYMSTTDYSVVNL